MRPTRLASSNRDRFAGPAIAGQQRAVGTYTAIVSYCYPDPYTHLCAPWTEMFRANFTIRAPVVTYTISGNTGTFSPTLTYDDGGLETVMSDWQAATPLHCQKGWSGTVRPLKTDWAFTPGDRTYTNLSTDLPGQDYVAMAVSSQTYLPLLMH